MNDTIGPLIVNIILGIVIYLFGSSEFFILPDIFKIIGLLVILGSVILIVYNIMPSVKRKRYKIEKSAKTVSFGQFYIMTVKHYMVRLVRWWIVFTLVLVVLLTSFIFLPAEALPEDDGGVASVSMSITDLPGYKYNPDDPTKNGRSPYVPITGIWEKIWKLRGAIPVFNYDYPLGAAVLVGFNKPANPIFLPLEFFTAGLFYLNSFIREPLAYVPILPDLIFYSFMSGIFGMIPLALVAAIIMWFFVAFVYGATPVLVGQVVKVPFRIFDWITFGIRFLFIMWTSVGILSAVLTTLIKVPLTFSTIITIILKIPLQILILLKMGFGFLIFAATATWGVLWFYGKGFSKIGFFTSKKTFGIVFSIVGLFIFLSGNIFGLIFTIIGFIIYLLRRSTGLGFYSGFKIIDLVHYIVLLIADIFTAPFRLLTRLLTGQGTTLTPVRRQVQKQKIRKW